MTHKTTTIFGFWVYLMTDLVLFAGLFAVYAVYSGGAKQGVFGAPDSLVETLALLTSSFTIGLALVSSRAHRAREALVFFGATFLLGAVFLGMELKEFTALVTFGDGPSASSYFSAYFALVGTHGLHIALGLVWMLALGVAVAAQGLTTANARKIELLATFWHFLDLVWIFIFTIVYLFSFL